jgi:hypothetical protein
MSRSFHIACILFALMLFAGCGGSLSDDQRLQIAFGEDRKAVVPLGGTILVDGKAERGVVVTLHNADGSKRIPVRAPYTDDEGHYFFTTYVGGDGIEPGKYILTFEWLNVVEKKKEGIQLQGPDKLSKSYSNPKTSKYSVEVLEDEPQTELDIELKSGG